jgi:hypothetical protein
MHKKRGYDRNTPDELVRDYKLFAIASEGRNTEPHYFELFRFISKRIKVDLIEEEVSDLEMLEKHRDKSAPRWVLDRAIKYTDKFGLSDEDELWFVMDIDKWRADQIAEIAEYCKSHLNWHIALSNPCFEVWIYFHHKADIAASKSITSQQFKKEISDMMDGGYHPYKLINLLPDAIKNAKNNDSNSGHYLPNNKETKVYHLGEALLQRIGRNDFEKFLKYTLPELKKKQALLYKKNSSTGKKSK